MRVKKEINIQIGERIKAAREEAQQTQEQLSERIEVSPQYISDLERGVVGISIPTLKRLCVALGVSSDLLLFGEQNLDLAAAMARMCSDLTPEQTRLLLEIVDNYRKAVLETK